MIEFVMNTKQTKNSLEIAIANTAENFYFSKGFSFI